jgi:hypothetical protein
LHIPCFCYCSAARHSTAHVWGTCSLGSMYGHV